MLHTIDKNSVTPYEFYQYMYAIKICKFPISLSFKGKYPIPQKGDL